MNAMKLTLESGSTDTEVIFLPMPIEYVDAEKNWLCGVVAPNILRLNCDESLLITSEEVVEIPDNTELFYCEESGINYYNHPDATCTVRRLYDTPFSEPHDAHFCTMYAEDCYIGEIYSKDFSYFDCPDCHRTICEQNPKNGWHVQYRFVDDEQVCNACVEQMLFLNGVTSDDWQETTLFFNYSDLEAKGFAKDDRIDYKRIWNDASIEDVTERIRELEDDNIVLVDIDRMAIGGLEGYVSIWYKPKETEVVDGNT